MHSTFWHPAHLCREISQLHAVGGRYYIYDKTQSNMWHELLRYAWHDFFIWGTWLIHMCGLTHSYVWLDSLRRGTWHIHMCGTTHPYVWYDIVSYMGHDSFIRVPWLPNLHGLRQRARWRARPYRYHMGFHIRHMGWVLGMWYPMWYLYAYWFCMPIAVDARAQVCRVWEYIHKDTHNTMQ